ncbi:hypothetical protein PSECIP111854_03836 [Pseudoalteromonas sp. CIP111854]|uniref:Uncharacterized protein n=1 Tax=Pseudoalteromonas holothuriae TaxID=2963714 RepID=A0A9W4R412_9GAMM|nr:hypothetical protein [Pseudoalteromonas sp. CIP111854]CAH9066178.1 hypothetical protein PSECIP111854_03836 [Pseudoalteromonas sp. CIP111854]
MKTMTKLTAILLLCGASVSTQANELTTDVTSDLSNIISKTISSSISNSLEELKATTLESVSFSLDNASTQTNQLIKQQTTLTKEATNNGE